MVPIFFNVLYLPFFFFMEHATARPLALHSPTTFSWPESIWLILTLSGGISCTALLVCALIIKNTNHALRKRLNMIKDGFSERLKQYEWLLEKTGQCLLIWEISTDSPRTIGNISTLRKAGISPENLHNFENWLEDNSLQKFHDALTQLRYNGRSFEFCITTTSQILLQVTGILAGTAVIVRFQDVSEQESENIRLQKNIAKVLTELRIQRNLLDHIQEPIWIRDHGGKISFSNRIFREITGIQDGSDDAVDLFHENAQRKRDEIGAIFQENIRTVIDGERRYFHLTRIATEEGTASFARDESLYKNCAHDMEYAFQSHYEMLDKISTAVAIFDSNQKLKFCNHAFKVLWTLDDSFLESKPNHALLLEHLREKGLIAEQPNWRVWKEDLLNASQKTEAQTQVWHLPDGRTVHVTFHPYLKGGVTWLYENLTEKIDLERRYNTLIKIQGETLDKLSEGVVVFGTDGRLRLSNPALSTLWALPCHLRVEGTHITQLQTHCSSLTLGNDWDQFAQCITGFSEKRDTLSGRMDLKNGTIIDYTLVPLPDGQTMLTFVNVTDTIHIERALQEKNEALESADRLRNEFVQHISYELRTPLTNIIGFSDILRDQLFGSVNKRQYEYLGHIHSESGALLNIVNDILDLATLDAGIMELDIKPVNISNAMAHAVERVKERLNGRHITLVQHIASSLDFISADAVRLRQIFVNVLSNAINFAPEKSTIDFLAHKENETIIFSIHNEGSDIPTDILDRVFKRFSAHSHHGRRAGAGLGLSLVKSFVELHGGHVEILTGMGKGTTVKCLFPTSQKNNPA